nr:unnamed protein product [Callosobruchus analis]
MAKAGVNTGKCSYSYKENCNKRVRAKKENGRCNPLNRTSRSRQTRPVARRAATSNTSPRRRRCRRPLRHLPPPPRGRDRGWCSSLPQGAPLAASAAPPVAAQAVPPVTRKQPLLTVINNRRRLILCSRTLLPLLSLLSYQRYLTSMVSRGRRRLIRCWHSIIIIMIQETAATQLGATMNSANKVPIPRLQTSAAAKLKQQAAAAAAAVAKLQHAKYKLLQPRQQQQQQQQSQCDITQSYNPQTLQAEGHRSQTVTNDLVDRNKERRNEGQVEDEVVDFPLTRERINSVSNVEKDAMDEYLGTNNEHDEELSKYFSNNNVNEPAQQDNTYKLSHLRQLLEQNGIAERKPSISQVIDANKIALNHLSSTAEDRPQVKTELAYMTPLAEPVSFANVLNSSAKRRVSFETPVPEEVILASPNTKRKNFSFTPISPGPQSPNGIQSKCSSTTASPFVSPRDTPVLKSKPPHQNVGILKTEARKPSKVKRELSLDLPSDYSTSSYMPMSAPVSPMLQKLLKSNSKLAYNPSYANCQNVAQTAQLFDNSVNTSRSQSVPLQQMVPDPISRLFISDPPAAPPPVPTNADFIDPIPENNGDNSKRIFNAATAALDQPQCDNVDLFNIDITTANNSCLNEFGIQLINNNVDLSEYARSEVRFPTAARSVRSQSIDVVTPFEVKCVPSRSVPSTPLPFICNSTSGTPPGGAGQKITFASSRSYPSTPLNSDETFTYNVNTDCLLNGQPIRSDSVADGLNEDGSCAVPIYDEMDKDFAIDGPEFQMVAAGDIESVLIEQNFSGNIN